MPQMTAEAQSREERKNETLVINEFNTKGKYIYGRIESLTACTRLVSDHNKYAESFCNSLLKFLEKWPVPRSVDFVYFILHVLRTSPSTRDHFGKVVARRAKDIIKAAAPINIQSLANICCLTELLQELRDYELLSKEEFNSLHEFLETIPQRIQAEKSITDSDVVSPLLQQDLIIRRMESDRARQKLQKQSETRIKQPDTEFKRLWASETGLTTSMLLEFKLHDELYHNSISRDVRTLEKM